MRENFTTLLRAQKFAHKHFFPWFDLPESGEYVQSPWKIDEETFLKNSDDILFIFVVRMHEDWLRSFFLEPNYVPKSIKNNSFFHFIHSEWKIDIPVLAGDYYKKDLPKGWTFTWPYPLSDEYYDSNVYAGRHFKNILELRSYKIRNYLQIGSKVKNFVVLRYEDVRDDPEGCVKYISALYGTPHEDSFIPILKHRGINESSVIYKRETLFFIPFYAQVYIEKNLDWEIEKKLGYSNHYLIYNDSPKNEAPTGI